MGVYVITNGEGGYIYRDEASGKYVPIQSFKKATQWDSIINANKVLDNCIAKNIRADYAESEGFKFGNIKPTEKGWSNIIAVEKRKQLCYVNFVGHMAFQYPSGVEGNFYRIDYKKYILGDDEYYYG